MGKKSKRRGGGGGGKKSRQTAVGAGDVGGSPRLAGDQLAAVAAGPTVTPADALALLETVQPPTSLKGTEGSGSGTIEGEPSTVGTCAGTGTTSTSTEGSAVGTCAGTGTTSTSTEGGDTAARG